jgi:hypothetical protein
MGEPKRKPRRVFITQRLPAEGFVAVHPRGAICLPVVPQTRQARRAAIWYSPTDRSTHHLFLGEWLRPLMSEESFTPHEARAWSRCKRSGWTIIRVRITEVLPKPRKPR